MNGDSERVREATTPQEREAIYRFRYGIYGRELGRKLGGPDHTRGRVVDAEDEESSTTHLYATADDGITGAIRLRHWAPGEIPAAVRNTYSIELLPSVETLHVAEMGRFMIRPDRRGHMTLVLLGTAAYDCMAGALGTDLAFVYCAPGLLRHYRHLGLRPYGGRLVATPDGVEIPLVMVLSDRGHFEAVGSFVAPRVPQHFGPGLRSPLDCAFEELFEVTEKSVELDADAVWSAVQAGIAADPHGDEGFLGGLSAQTIERLSAEGVLLRVSAGTLLTERGLRQQELFVVIDGVFEASDGEQQLRLMGPGELFGEIAFFHGAGRRTASVRALSDGAALAVRRHAIDDLRARDPATAAELLFQIGRVMATRFSATPPPPRTDLVSR